MELVSKRYFKYETMIKEPSFKNYIRFNRKGWNDIL